MKPALTEARQATILVAVVLLVALPLGIAAGRLLHEAAMDEIGARTDISLPVLPLTAAVFGLVVLANLAAALPVRQARRAAPAVVLAEE